MIREIVRLPETDDMSPMGSAETYTDLVARTGGHIVALAALIHAHTTIPDAAAGIWGLAIVVAMITEIGLTGAWAWSTASRTRLRRKTEGYES
ncbi:hypothetical protein [Halorubrum ezzemoulense]|uniref:Uncharacterized protein n=1 Tax=Halorubrum ezzemoulense TaxID=337243 RepID=A0A256JTN3_HALEZ|nr:hypothetical protein [Halorubrum ezzemoulense]OYR71577.1 hypothetical protein DJ78_05020 [Halorubrum ezzemoulense]